MEEGDRRISDAGLSEAAVEFLRAAIPELQAVYLFGSRARGRARLGSDFDLAVLAPDRIPGLARWEIQEELAILLKADVDLIDLRQVSTVMQMQVVTTGGVLYDGDPYQRQCFEMRVLSAYALLNEERSGIIEQIHEEGRIYDR